MKYLVLISTFILVNFSFAQKNNSYIDYDSIAEECFNNSDYIRSTEYSKKALAIAVKQANDSLIANQLRRLSYSSDFMGQYDICQEYNFQLLEIYVENNNLSGEASALNDIGIIHYYKEEYRQSLKYTFKALAIYKELNDTSGTAMCYNNIANCKTDDGELKEGVEYYFKALEINKILKDHESIVMCLGNIGETFYVMDDYENSSIYYKEAVSIANRNNVDIWYLMSPYLGLAQFFIDEHKLDSAIWYADKVYEITINNNFRAEKAQVFHIYSNIYDDLKDFEKSLEYYKKYKSLEDTIYKDQNNSKIAEMTAKYELAEKEKQFQIQNNELEVEKQKSKIEKWVIIIMVVFILAVAGFSFFIYRENKERKWANYVLNETNDFLEQSFKDVRESIQYARKIQDSILPKVESIKESFPKSFILYEPKDVVSGDFYWFDKVDGVSLLSVVDCTGHGVPGAFMSIMASNLLNQVILDESIKHPIEAFKMLDERLKFNLNQDENTDSSNDGFDLSLIAYHEKEKKIEFCGAKNNIYLISNGELIVKKASRSSIGGGVLNKKFIGEDFQVNEGDIIYMFTDGFADQFGGEKDKKFSYKRLRKTLLDNHQLTMEDQQEELQIIFDKWKGNNEQIDDICIVGIKF